MLKNLLNKYWIGQRVQSFAVLFAIQLLSHVWLFETPWNVATLSFTISHSLLKFMFTESVILSNHLILCHCPLLLPSLFPSGSFPMSRVFSNESGLFQWVGSLQQVVKDWSFSFNINPSNEYSGLISFRIDWFDLLAVQRTLKSLFQHHSSKTSILWHSVFFMVQLSHLYMTTRKTIALIIWTFYIILYIYLTILFTVSYGKAQMKFMVNTIYTTPPSFNLSEPQLFHL